MQLQLIILVVKGAKVYEVVAELGFVLISLQFVYKGLNDGR